MKRTSYYKELTVQSHEKTALASSLTVPTATDFTGTMVILREAEMMPLEGNSLQVRLSSGESAETASAGHPLPSFLITGRHG